MWSNYYIYWNYKFLTCMEHSWNIYENSQITINRTIILHYKIQSKNKVWDDHWSTIIKQKVQSIHVFYVVKKKKCGGGGGGGGVIKKIRLKLKYE